VGAAFATGVAGAEGDDRVWEPGSLNVTAHVGADARAVLRCSGYGDVDPFAEITALRVPKVTQKYIH
jgi:hypothetical protein